jgi:hypothetical protein
MRLKICLVGLLLAVLAGPARAAWTQSADPLTGTWKGDWGPSPTDRNAVTLELKWDGKTLSGTINPGPDAIEIENAAFDPKTRKIHLEANLAARNRRYVVDGAVETDKMSGTWNHPRRKGDFQLTREAATAGASATPQNPGLVGLTGNERRVVEYLLKDWGTDFSVTSVDIAMDALKLRRSDELRFRIGNHIKNHPELHAVLRRWGWETVVLTPNEKLVARAIVNAERDKQRPPSKAELAKMVGMSAKEVERAVEVLARYGILKRDRSVGGVGYVATKPRYVNWQPWLDFQFHRVTIASGRTFCVN